MIMTSVTSLFKLVLARNFLLAPELVVVEGVDHHVLLKVFVIILVIVCLNRRCHNQNY